MPNNLNQAVALLKAERKAKSSVGEKVAWYWNRLRSMPSGEIAHRIVETVKRQSGRRLGGLSGFDVGDGPLPAFPLLDPTGALDHPDLIAAWEAVAAAARTGKFESLGKEWPGETGASKWYLDPVSRKAWSSEAYCFDINYRHTSDFGDVKYVWELNRLQFLQPIAALAVLKNDNVLKRFCCDEIESWIDANPPFRGINWCSGIETAIRIVSICFVTGVLGEDAIDPQLRRKIRNGLNAHGFWLRRFPSRFSSANNHLVAEAAGLYVLGTLQPDLADAKTYADYGYRTLVEEASKQILDDGIGAEQSPTYTAFVLEWYLLCVGLAEAVGRPFPDGVYRRLASAAIFLRWITDDGGNQPRFGDDDEGIVLCSQNGHETDYVSSVLGSLSAALKRPDVAPPINRAHLRNLIFGWPAPSTTGPHGLKWFENGGYSILRQAMNGRNVLLMMDHGPLGYLSIAAHGHADALAIWLHIDDIPVFVDAGTYLYHSGKEIRDYFRNTGAHNTLTISGESQSIVSGTFNWSHKAEAALLDECEDLDRWRIEAEHDGYQARKGIIHRRAVERDGENGIAVRDWLTGHAAADTDTAIIRYLISPDLDVARTANCTVRISHGGKPLLDMTLAATESGPPSAQVLIERREVSPCFGRRCETSAVSLVTTTKALRTEPITMKLRVL